MASKTPSTRKLMGELGMTGKDPRTPEEKRTQAIMQIQKTASELSNCCDMLELPFLSYLLDMAVEEAGRVLERSE